MATAASRCRIASVLAVDVRGRDVARGALLSFGWSRTWMQRRSDQNRIDVQHGADADDLLRLHVLSVERARKLSDSSEDRAAKSARVRKRGTAWSARAAVSAPFGCRSFAGAANF